MLKKENRLQKEKEFSRVFKGSRPIYTENLVLRFVKQPQVLKPDTRFGFVISNKINKLATRRNALKRQLRAVIQDQLSNIKVGYNVVITVKSDFDYPYYQDSIRKQVEEGLKKAGLL